MPHRITESMNPCPIPHCLSREALPEQVGIAALVNAGEGARRFKRWSWTANLHGLTQRGWASSWPSVRVAALRRKVNLFPSRMATSTGFMFGGGTSQVFAMKQDFCLYRSFRSNR
jgi:hypothetical protein